MKNAILILFSILTLSSCSGEIDLDKEKKTKLTFDQLPPELKKIYGTKFPTGNDSIDYYVFSLDKNYELTHYWTGMNKQLLTKGFNHHFVINGKEFKLGANQGDPFVLRNKKLYYSTELNLAEYIFEKAKFIEIDLTEYLNE
ncbi:MAG: hypothetical protein CMO82_13655 [Winogradskyella sp.]|nr:hypothetical protein [Winogradskyella sp.]|tara:strand:- start:1373 stop:1798 length:426 start_codon:yes stop_codon:yes gene_type:complete